MTTEKFCTNFHHQSAARWRKKVPRDARELWKLSLIEKKCDVNYVFREIFTFTQVLRVKAIFFLPPLFIIFLLSPRVHLYVKKFAYAYVQDMEVQLSEIYILIYEFRHSEEK